MVMISTISTIYSTIIGGWNLHHRAKICQALMGTASRVAADAERPLLAPRLTNVILSELGSLIDSYISDP